MSLGQLYRVRSKPCLEESNLEFSVAVCIYERLFIVIFGIVSFLMSVFCRMASKKKELTGKDYLYATVITFGPIMLLMARSFGAISIWTIGLIAIFLFLVGFLVYKKV